MKKLLLCNLFVWLLLANVMSQNTITPVMPTLNGSTYLIENAGNMHWLNENWINADVYESSIKGKSFRVSQENMNIDLGEWHSNINLATKFEGNNSTFTFTSSSDNATSATGLFLTLTDCAQVQDVHVVADIYASTNTTPVGILCNRIVSSKSTLTEQIEIQVYDVITDGYIHSSPFEAGAIAGTSEAYTDIRRCFNKATVESCRAAGGIVGAVLQKTRNFTLSSTGNIGIVKAICTKYEQQLDGGGLLGYIEEVDGMASIYECYNRGTIFSKTIAGVSPTYMLNLGMLIGSTSEYQTNMTLTQSISYLDGNVADNDDDISVAGVYRFGVRSDNPKLVGSSFPGMLDREGLMLYFYYADGNGDAINGSMSKESFNSGEIAYTLGSGERGSWLQDPSWTYPILASGKEGEGDEVYKHGDTYSKFYHEYDENGFCIHGDGCYEEAEYDYNYNGFIISNAGQFIRLNEENRIGLGCHLHFGKYDSDARTILPVVIDLHVGNRNWKSQLKAFNNIYGHGSTIKFVSTFDDDINAPDFEMPLYTVTGLFCSVTNEESKVEKIEISDLNIYADMVDDKSGSMDNVVGMLANIVEGSSKVVVNNVKLHNYDGSSTGIKAYSSATGALFGKIAPSNESEVTITNVVSDVNIEGASVIGGLVGSTTAPVKLTYSASKGKMVFNPRVGFVETPVTTMGGLIGLSDNPYTSVQYCYTTAKMENSVREGVMMGAFIGHIQDPTFENVTRSFAFYPDVESEPRNFNNAVPVYRIGSEMAQGEEVYLPSDKEQASSIMTDDIEANLYYYYPSIDKFQDGKMLKRFKSGYVAYQIIGYDDSVFPNFSQNLGESDPKKHEYHVRLACELNDGEDQYFIYPTCDADYVLFSNVNRWVKDPETHEMYCEHNFDSYHICKYCKAVDTEFFKDNSEINIESTEDLTNMTDQVSVLTQAGIPADIKVYADIVYDDVDYQDLSVGQLEALLPEKSSIGTKEKQFEGSFEGEGYDFVNFAFQQNGLFNYIGESGAVSNLNIVNGVILNNLESEDIVKDVENNIIYAAALANVNYGNISYSSFVGAMATPDGVENVTNCLVGENHGTVSYSFAYFTDLETVKENSPNKAAIIVKGNCGVGRGSAGQIKKVAANTNAKTETTGDPYYTPDEAELLQGDRVFSNDEFASGVVAYWMNFDGDGYLGNYTCMYRQGTLTPELSDGGVDAVHKIVYSSNKPSAVISGKAFENSGATLTINLSEAATSVKIGSTLATLTNDNTRATIVVPETSEADVTVEVSFAGATDIETVTPEAGANVMVVDGRLMVFNAEGQDVTLYNVNGSVVCSSVVTSSRVALPAINRGIYFVKVGTTTRKIVF